MMDTQEIIRIGREAKRETEDFINDYINDGTKGWPKVCVCGPSYDELIRRPVEGRGGRYSGRHN